MDYLKEGIGLRAMGQRDPLVEVQGRGAQMFRRWLSVSARESVSRCSYNKQFERALAAAEEEAEWFDHSRASGWRGAERPVAFCGGYRARQEVAAARSPLLRRRARTVAHARSVMGSVGQRRLQRPHELQLAEVRSTSSSAVADRAGAVRSPEAPPPLALMTGEGSCGVPHPVIVCADDAQASSRPVAIQRHGIPQEAQGQGVDARWRR